MSSLIILCGKSGSGKTTVCKYLSENYGFDRIVTYTTRPKRDLEVDGVDYNFISNDAFCRLKENNFFIETASYMTDKGEWFYGTSMADVLKPNSIIVLTPSGIVALKDKHIPCKVFYLDCDEETLKTRLIARGDETEEISRRLKKDSEDFRDIEHLVDRQINVSHMNIEEIIFEILNEERR